MLCEKCGQKQATVHMQQVVNGQTREHHLCADCAALSESMSFNQFFQELLNVFAQSPQNSPQEGQLSEGLRAGLGLSRCPTCGMTFTDFRSGGKLGCVDCYTTFRREIDSILKNVQASGTHQGKFPQRAGAHLLTKRKVDQLRLVLAKAVESEHYEEAARLRDQIREMEAVL